MILVQNNMKYLLLLSVSIITISSAPCSNTLGSKQNTIIKRHLPKDFMMHKSLEKFEKKFESIKTMPWDYKYRRHINKVNWEQPRFLGAQRDNAQDRGYMKTNGSLQKHELKKDLPKYKENFVRNTEKQAYPKKFAKENVMSRNSAVSKQEPIQNSENKNVERELQRSIQ